MVFFKIVGKIRIENLCLSSRRTERTHFVTVRLSTLGFNSVLLTYCQSEIFIRGGYWAAVVGSLCLLTLTFLRYLASK